MNTAVTIAAFAAIAAALYVFISAVIRETDRRYERHSAEFRRKHSG
jgi:hypothetical protein